MEQFDPELWKKAKEQAKKELEDEQKRPKIRELEGRPVINILRQAIPLTWLSIRRILKFGTNVYKQFSEKKQPDKTGAKRLTREIIDRTEIVGRGLEELIQKIRSKLKKEPTTEEIWEEMGSSKKSEEELKKINKKAKNKTESSKEAEERLQNKATWREKLPYFMGGAALVIGLSSMITWFSYQNQPINKNILTKTQKETQLKSENFSILKDIDQESFKKKVKQLVKENNKESYIWQKATKEERRMAEIVLSLIKHDFIPSGFTLNMGISNTTVFHELTKTDQNKIIDLAREISGKETAKATTSIKTTEPKEIIYYQDPNVIVSSEDLKPTYTDDPSGDFYGEEESKDPRFNKPVEPEEGANKSNIENTGSTNPEYQQKFEELKEQNNISENQEKTDQTNETGSTNPEYQQKFEELEESATKVTPYTPPSTDEEEPDNLTKIPTTQIHKATDEYLQRLNELN